MLNLLNVVKVERKSNTWVQLRADGTGVQLRGIARNKGKTIYSTNYGTKVTEHDIKTSQPGEDVKYISQFKPGDVVFDSFTGEKVAIKFIKLIVSKKRESDGRPVFMYVDTLNGFHNEETLELV